MVAKHGFNLRKTKNRVASAVGSAGHKVLASILKGKEFNAAVRDGMDEFEKLESKGLWWDEITATSRDVRTQIARIGRAGMATQKGKETLHVEKTLQVATHIEGWLVEGTPDHIHTRGLEDWKTGRDGAFSLQLTLYKDLALAHALLPERADELNVIRVPRTHPDKPQQPAEIKPAFYMPKEAKGSITRIADMVDRFEVTGDPQIFASNPISNICTNKDCPVWGTEFCDSWKDKEKTK